MSPFLLPPVALVAGVLSFSSPCCLPLLPGYVSYISAVPVAGLDTRTAKAATLRASLSFVLGFGVVFTGLGVLSGFFGSAMLHILPTVIRVMGVGIIIFGLTMIGLLRVPALLRERRIDPARLPKGPKGAFLVGVAFAAGWTPCIGPVLATILAAAAATSTIAWGAFLLGLYSIGLGVPFILLALGLGRAKGSFDWLRRNGRRIEIVGGVALVGVGILFVTGAWTSFFHPLQS